MIRNVFTLYTCIYAPAQQEQKVKMWNNRICESTHIYTHIQCVYLHHLEAAITLEEEELINQHLPHSRNMSMGT